MKIRNRMVKEATGFVEINWNKSVSIKIYKTEIKFIYKKKKNLLTESLKK